MNIYIEYNGVLDISKVKSGENLDIGDAETRIGDLLSRFDVPADQQRFIAAFVNGRETRLNYILRDGDKLRLFLPLGGG